MNGGVAGGASSRSMDVNSSSVKSVRHASRSGALRFHGLKIERKRDAAVDGDQFFRKQHRIAILLQRLAIALALDLAGAVEDGLHAAEFDNQIDASFVADSGCAGNLSMLSPRRAITSTTFSGGTPRTSSTLAAIEDQVVLLRIEDLHMRRDELHHVLVAGDDEDLVATLGSFAGQCADHVVGLEADSLENGNVQCLERAANVGDLAAKILWHRLALGLVALVAHLFEALRLGVPLAQRANGAGALVAKDCAAGVEDGGKIVRREILAQLLDHVDEDIGRRRRQRRSAWTWAGCAASRDRRGR